MSGGWTPSVHLFSQSRGKLAFDEALQVFMPGASAQRERSAGRLHATFDLASALAEGDAAGRAAAAAAGFVAADARVYAVDGAPATMSAGAASPPRADRRGKAFVDFQNDVSAKDLEPRGAGGLPLDRACQALHHDRHGDRSGQDART